MIALLFALLLVAMLLAWGNRKRSALAVFAVTLLMSIYWFRFHATETLAIVL